MFAEPNLPGLDLTEGAWGGGGGGNGVDGPREPMTAGCPQQLTDDRRSVSVPIRVSQGVRRPRTLAALINFAADILLVSIIFP